MRLEFLIHLVMVMLMCGVLAASPLSSQEIVERRPLGPVELATPEMSSTLGQVLTELESSSNEPHRFAEIWHQHRSQLCRAREAAVSVLSPVLRSGQEVRRLAAVYLLGKLWGSTAVGMLQDLVEGDPEPAVRLAVLEALVWGSGFVDVAHVLRESHEKYPHEEKAVLSTTYGMKDAETLLLELVAVVSKPPVGVEAVMRPPQWGRDDDARGSPETAVRVSEILENVIRQSTGPTGAVTKYIYTEDQLRELRELGPAALPSLVEAFANPRYSNRLVTRPLAEFGGWELVAPLSDIVLEHPEPARRQQALRFLLDVSHFEDLLHILVQLASEETDTEIGRFAESVLAACRPPDREPPPS